MAADVPKGGWSDQIKAPPSPIPHVTRISNIDGPRPTQRDTFVTRMFLYVQIRSRRIILSTFSSPLFVSTQQLPSQQETPVGLQTCNDLLTQLDPLRCPDPQAWYSTAPSQHQHTFDWTNPVSVSTH
jgi:hypothetical protein